ncbi:hypothetical protein PGT21_010086 [Puccinia graminis f. sp. tritici]|uniref:HAT C-terminal dimerisation domain-containing protein n=1 Tax=Puccinia graminis f. sp. tritici TaxID=56615 RepID=A0A5B0PXL7_PUCGR|nr:hypothetical protein PGT21_010086 [Puccinia graminis f. sp. tritici]
MSNSRDTTPPNEASSRSNPRQSARKCTPLKRPGFIATHPDSRRAVQAPPTSPCAIHVQPTSLKHPEKPPQASSKTKQQAKGTTTNDLSPTTVSSGTEVVINVEQDSDKENKKAPGPKEPKKVKGGFDNPKLYFHDGYQASDQEGESLTYKCRWCPKSVRCPMSTNSNLKTHRDGSITQNGVRKSCVGRAKAVADGGNFPQSLDEQEAASKKKNNSTATISAYVQKGRFDIKTMNMLLLFWIIRQSLPWARFNDYHLGVAFDYCNANSVVYSATWAANHARKLYNILQARVIADIKDSKSKVALVADVWTTKGNHKAFIGITSCYINKQWKYVSQNLALKYVSWHHNGKYLAAPFANVLTKHDLHNQINSGSNNFTMAKELAAIIRQRKGDFSHYLESHPRFFCHVLALILGAGLRSLKLKNPVLPPSKTPEYFPTLETIQEANEEVILVDAQPLRTANVDIEENDKTEEEDIDPDDASECGEPGSPDDDEVQLDRLGASSKPEHSEGGIGHTLVKVGAQLILGYEIRWNVAYDSWQRAYAARKVIGQLLNDESDKYAGKSSAGHFFKGYEISKKEWENVNCLTKVLEEFLVTTMRMEGDGPNASMVLYEYYRLIENLEKRKKLPEFSALQVMFDPMINIAKKYLKLALECNSTLLATIFHPAWRLSLIKDKFPEYSNIAKRLVEGAFQAKIKAYQTTAPQATTPEVPQEDSDKDKFNYYPNKSASSQDNNELKKYLDGVWPLSKKGDSLQWWKTHESEFPRLAMVARDVLACAATSATVERTFSAAADVCATGRSSLAAATIKRCVSSSRWLQKGIKADGDFADCQSVLDTAEVNAKFATQVRNLNKKMKATSIKHVGPPKK